MTSELLCKKCGIPLDELFEDEFCQDCELENITNRTIEINDRMEGMD